MVGNEASSHAGRYALGVGFCIGLLFGLLILLFGFGAAVGVLLLGALGALVGWLVYGFFSGGLDFGAAWRTLRRQ